MKKLFWNLNGFFRRDRKLVYLRNVDGRVHLDEIQKPESHRPTEFVIYDKQGRPVYLKPTGKSRWT